MKNIYRILLVDNIKPSKKRFKFINTFLVQKGENYELL